MDEVGDEMDKEADDEAAYGAEMEDAPEADSEEAQEDLVLAGKQVAKALGLTPKDPVQFSEALKTFIRAC
jgi:hypothetical protein